MAVGTYRYLFYDLVTNAPLADLPLKRVSFERRLNEVGSLRGYLPIADPNVQKLLGQTNPWAATPGGRTALYVDRNGTLVWGGIVVTRKYSQGSNTQGSVGPFMMELGCSEFMWYFADKRVIDYEAVFTGIDQLTIAQNLINTAQSVRNGNIGVAVPTNTSGVLRSQTWHAQDRKKVGRALMDLAQLDNGFDWIIDVDYGIGGQVPGVPGKQLRLGYPRIGNTFQTTGWMFEFPGNIADYAWAEDSSLQAITVYMQGQGMGQNMAQSSNSVTSLLDAGYPQLDDVFSLKDGTDPATIGARAVSFAKAYSSPVTLITLLVRPDLDPVFGSYRIGDDVNLRITSPQYPVQPGSVGYDQFWRIVAQRVDPQEDDRPERVYLTMGAIPT